MYSFHCSIHALPAGVKAGPPIELFGGTYSTLAITREQLESSAFSVSFEEARSALALLERMYTEPDGSWVWTSCDADAPWQVDGNLFDRGGRLLFVDAKGNCPADEFDEILRAFGWPATPLMFQLVRQAVFLDEAEFRRFAVSSGES